MRTDNFRRGRDETRIRRKLTFSSHVTSSVLLLLLLSMIVTVVDGSNTPSNLEEIFIGRCYEYQQITRPDLFLNGEKNCSDLYRLFTEAYAYKDPCNVSVESFDDFSEAAKHDIYTTDRVMYWSGAVVPLVYEFHAEGRRYTTIRDILGGYILKNLDQWCSQLEDPGINYESCPPYYECTFQAQTSCWKSLSRSFALQVQGSIHVVLNGSSGLAYRNQSTFSNYELEYLDAERNPVLYVQLIHNIEEPDINRETCENGTLLEMKKVVEQKNIEFSCTDDPIDLLFFQCVDHVKADRCTAVNYEISNTASLQSLPNYEFLYLLIYLLVHRNL